MPKARLSLTVVFFFVISQLPPLLLAGQPLQVSGEKNQPATSVAKALNEQNSDQLKKLKEEIQAAIDNPQNKKIYQAILDRAKEASAPRWLDSEIKREEEEAATQASKIDKMAADLKKLMDERPPPDGLDRIMSFHGAVIQEPEFGGQDKGKTASEALKDIDSKILKNPSNLIKKAGVEAKPFANKIKTNLINQKRAWDTYFGKLNSLAKRANASNANANALTAELNRLSPPESADLSPSPTSAAGILLKGMQTMEFFSRTWPLWNMESEIVRVNYLKHAANDYLDLGAQRINQKVSELDTTLTFIDKSMEILEKIPQENLDSKIQTAIQSLFNTYSQIKADFPEKREKLLRFLEETYFDPYHKVLAELGPYREKLINDYKDLQAGKSVGERPPRPQILTSDGWPEFPLIFSMSPSYLEPFDSLLHTSRTLEIKIAFLLKIYLREGPVKFQEIKKGNLTSKTPPGWPRQQDFVIKDTKTAEPISKIAKLEDTPYFFIPGSYDPSQDFYHPHDVWFVTTSTSKKVSVSDVKIENGKLIVTVKDEERPKNTAQGLFYHIFQLGDGVIDYSDVIAALDGGAPVEFVHILA